MWAERATRDSLTDIETHVRNYFEKTAREASLGDPVLAGETLEYDALKAGLTIARVMYQQALQRDRGHRGASVQGRTKQGQLIELPFQGYEDHSVTSFLGQVTLSRAYYHLDGTPYSRWPREEELGWVASEDRTPLLQRWVMEDAIDASFKPAIEKMNQRFGLQLSYGSSQALCTGVGTFLVQQQEELARAVGAPGSHPEVEAQFANKRPEMMVITTDGGAGPVRQYKEKTREVKLGAVYVMSPSNAQKAPEEVEAYVRKGLSEANVAELERHASATDPVLLNAVPASALCPEIPPGLAASPYSGDSSRRGAAAVAAGAHDAKENSQGVSKLSRKPLRVVRPGETPETSLRWEQVPDSKRYIATIQNSKVLGVLLYWLAVQMGYLQAKVVVFLADGAKWCWNEMRTHFPDAIGILDNFHLREKVEEAARLIFGPHELDAAGVWARCVFSLLVHGRVARVIEILREMEVHDALKKEGVHLLLTYVKNNRQQMDYPRYIAMGLPIGSGVIEGGIKHVIGSRVKGSGRRWLLEGLAAMSALRAERCSDRIVLAWRAFRGHLLAA